MIEFQNISVMYRDRQALDCVDLTVPDGKVTVLLGPNGSGKSTLIKAAAGILSLSRGRILAEGDDIRSLKPSLLARRVSYMAQARNTPNILARKMVLHGRFPYLSYPRHYSSGDLAAAERALAAVDALDIAGEPMPELSGGQRQKIYLAMTLAQDTNTVLMDEPLNFLDVQHQLALARLAHDLAGAGKAVLLVMHDIRLAMETADIIAVMEAGRLCASASPPEIFASGIIDRVFNIRLLIADTPYGPQYYYGPAVSGGAGL